MTPGYDGSLPVADDFEPAARDQLQSIFGQGVRDEHGSASPAAARSAARALRQPVTRDETERIVHAAGHSAAGAVRAKARKRSGEEKPGAA